MDVVNLCVMKPNRSEVLLINRANPPYRGYWGLLGGRVNPGENSCDAAVRELREECGLIREPKQPQGHLSEQIYRSGNPGVINISECTLVYDLDINFYRFFGDKEVKTGKSLEGFLKWFSFNRIPNLKIIPSDPWMISVCLGEKFRNLKSRIREFNSEYFLHNMLPRGVEE